MIKRFRKTPIVIEAVQYVGSNRKEIVEFTKGTATSNTCYEYVTIPTLAGNHRVSVGDWVIRGIAGEFYPCTAAIFDETYEEVVEDE